MVIVTRIDILISLIVIHLTIKIHTETKIMVVVLIHLVAKLIKVIHTLNISICRL